MQQLLQQNSNLSSELNAVTYERDSLLRQVSLYTDLAGRSGTQITAVGYHYHPPDYRIQERSKMITTYVTLRNTENKTMCATLSYNIARITSNTTRGDIRHQEEVCVPPNTDSFNYLREFKDLVAIQNDAPQVEIRLIRVREG